MKLFRCLLSLLPALTLSAGAAEAPRPKPEAESGIGRMVADAVFTDLAGAPRRLSEVAAPQSFTVLAAVSPSCPLSRKFASTLAALEDEWREKGVRFVFFGSIEADTAGELAAEAKERGWDGLLTRDADRALARALHAETTTEIFVIDRARTLQYRGAVSDQYGLGYQKDAPEHDYLADALKELTAGRLARPAATTAPGCALDLPSGEESASAISASSSTPAVTWHRDISRVIQRNCQECHREGGTGPFELMTKEDVTGHAGMIKKVVSKGIMPPWFAAPQSGEHAVMWANDRSLTEQDRAALLGWLDHGRAEGDPKDAPVPRVWPQDWVMGTPDAVFPLREPVKVKANGRMNYILQEVETSFTEDRWVTAVEVRPSAMAQVHHVLVFAAPAGKKVDDGDDFLAAYVPGSSYVDYPAGYAKRLPAGSRIVFQLHYTPNGTEAVDTTRLGLKFSTEAPKFEVHVAAVKNHRFAIPPGADNHEVKAELPIPFDCQVLSFMPHMHMRGKSFKYELVTTEGARRDLLNVPAYDFNWQLLYRVAEPLSLTRGSRLEATAHFDNSAGNPANPDPSQTVRWGLQTEEEMMIGYLEYARIPETAPRAGAGDPPLALTPRTMVALGRRLDVNRDGKISLEEAGATFLGLHHRLDADRDGYVTRTEAREAMRR